MYKLTPPERETTINWCTLDNIAYIDTADRKVIRKLDKLVSAYPDVYLCVRVDENFKAKQYNVPVELIRFAKPVSAARKEAARRTVEKINTH